MKDGCGKMTHLLLFGTESGILLPGFLGSLRDVQLLVTRSLVSRNPICEVQLPRTRSELWWL